MTIKLMPVFFFYPGVFSHLAALKTNYQLKRDIKWSRTSDPKTPPPRHKWLRQSGRHQKVNTDIHRGAWVAATSIVHPYCQPELVFVISDPKLSPHLIPA